MTNDINDPSPSASEIIKRAKVAFKVQQNSEPELRDIYKYAMPNRNGYESADSRMVDVYDSTAINSTMRFANRLQTDLTPPFQRWMEIKAGPAFGTDDERHDADVDLGEISEIVLATLTAGGFTTAAHEVYQDLAAGQGAMMILKGDDEKPVRYVAAPASQVATEEGQWGDIIGFFWKKNIEISLLKNYWPEAKFSAELQKHITDSRGDKDDKVVTYIAMTRVGLAKKWIYSVVLEKNSEKIFTETFDYQPFVAPRWSKLAGDKRGRGPLHLALPDIKTLNKVKELILMNAALAIVGVYTVIDDGVLNPDTLQVVPGGLISVSSNGSGFSGPSIKELPTGRNFDIAQLVMEDLKVSIKKIMLDDQLPPDLGPVRSATEIVARAKELAQDSGAAFGRLMDEWITPVIQSTIDILIDLGVIKAKSIPLDNIAFKVQVLSTLARVQDLADVEAVTQYLSVSQSLFGQEATLISTKMEELQPWLAGRMGVPAKFVRGEDEREEFSAEIAEMIAKQQQAVNQSQQNNQPNTAEGTLAA